MARLNNLAMCENLRGGGIVKESVMKMGLQKG